MWLKFHKALVTWYVLPRHQVFSHLDHSFYILGYPTIIHQQLVAMLLGHMKFVCIRQYRRKSLLLCHDDITHWSMLIGIVLIKNAYISCDIETKASLS